MATRLQTLQRDVFEAFSISDGPLTGVGKLLRLDSADTLDRCLALSSPRVPHKAKFMVRHTDTLSGAVTLKFYAVKQKGRGERRWSYGETRVVHDRYAEHLFDLDAGAL